MTENEKSNSAEKRITDALANQAKQDPGSAEEEHTKEERAQAETEFRKAK